MKSKKTFLQTTCRRVPIHKTFPRRKLTTCARPVKETLINNSLTGKELFHRSNEKWSQAEPEIYFFPTRDLIGELQTINISQATCRCVPIHRTFSGGEISERKRRAAKTLINNSLLKEIIFLPFVWTIFVK